MALIDKLEVFRELLANQEPLTLAKLRPGLPRDEVQAKLATLPFQISDDAVTLYTWADASFKQTDEPPELLPGSHFYGLDTSLAEFEQLYPIQQDLDETFAQPYRDSFRFLGDYSDGGYSFGSLEAPCNGAIVDLVIHAEWQLAFESLEKLIDTAIACRQRGVFSDLEIPDFDPFYEIGRELNPGMLAWIED